jgi:hypothetical protein
MNTAAMMSEPAKNLVETLKVLDHDGTGVPLGQLTESAAQEYVGLEVEAALQECLTGGWIALDDGAPEEEPRVRLGRER